MYTPKLLYCMTSVQSKCQATVFRCCIAVGCLTVVTADSSAVMPIAASLIIAHLEEIILVFGIVIFKFATVQAYPEALVTIALTQIAQAFTQGSVLLSPGQCCCVLQMADSIYSSALSNFYIGDCVAVNMVDGICLHLADEQTFVYLNVKFCRTVIVNLQAVFNEAF